MLLPLVRRTASLIAEFANLEERVGNALEEKQIYLVILILGMLSENAVKTCGILW